MFGTLFLPNFSLQVVLRNEPSLRTHPVAVLDDLAAKAPILELNEVATAAGVNRQMTASQGLARCSSLILKSRAVEQERVVQEILLQHAFMVSPFVEASGAGLCTIQFTASSDLRQKIQAILQHLQNLQLDVRAGLASSPDISLMAAHRARPLLCVGNQKQFLEALPLEILAIS